MIDTEENILNNENQIPTESNQDYTDQTYVTLESLQYYTNKLKNNEVTKSIFGESIWGKGDISPVANNTLGGVIIRGPQNPKQVEGYEVSGLKIVGTADLQISHDGSLTIDTGEYYNQLSVNPSDNGGLKNESGQLGIKIGSGEPFTLNKDGLGLRLGPGIQLLSGEVIANLGPGLGTDSNGQIVPELGSGLGTDINGQIVPELGSGLIFIDERITPNLGPGLGTDNNGQIVPNIGNGLEIDVVNKIVPKLSLGLVNTEYGLQVDYHLNGGLTFIGTSESNPLKPALGINCGNGLKIDNDSSQIVPNLGNGLKIDEDYKIAPNLGNGLKIDEDYKIAPNLGSGLTVNLGQIVPKLDFGLEFNSKGQIAPNLGSGLTVNLGQIVPNLGPGLGTNINGQIIPNLGGGLGFNKDQIIPNLGPGLGTNINGQIIPNLGPGLKIDNDSGQIVLNLGRGIEMKGYGLEASLHSRGGLVFMGTEELHQLNPAFGINCGNGLAVVGGKTISYPTSPEIEIKCEKIRNDINTINNILDIEYTLKPQFTYGGSVEIQFVPGGNTSYKVLKAIYHISLNEAIQEIINKRKNCKIYINGSGVALGTQPGNNSLVYVPVDIQYSSEYNILWLSNSSIMVNLYNEDSTIRATITDEKVGVDTSVWYEIEIIPINNFDNQGLHGVYIPSVNPDYGLIAKITAYKSTTSE